MSAIGKLSSPNSQTPDQKAREMDQKLRDVAEQYERHFLREMMKQMRATVSEGGLLKQNNAEKLFRDQLDDQYAEQWSKGGGVGFGKIIHDQLIEKYGQRLGLKAPIDKPQGPLEMNGKVQYTGNVTPSGQTSVPQTAPAQMAPPVESVSVAENVNRSVETQKKLEDETALPAPEIRDRLERTAAKALQTQSPVTFKFQTTENDQQTITSPWAGVLLDKKFLEMDRIQYRIKHDNGLESLILTRGTGLGPEQKLALGDAIEAGQALGRVSSASPLFWTVKPIVSE